MARKLLTALAAAVVLGGCGGGDGQAQRDFARRADAVCKRANVTRARFNAELRAAQQGSDPNAIFKRLATLTRQAATALQPGFDELDALAPPAADRDKIKAWIAAQRRQAALLVTLSTALGKQDGASVARLSEQVDALGRSTRAFARRYGMKQCGREV